jgi:hypothetical protein
VLINETQVQTGGQGVVNQVPVAACATRQAAVSLGAALDTVTVWPGSGPAGHSDVWLSTRGPMKARRLVIVAILFLSTLLLILGGISLVTVVQWYRVRQQPTPVPALFSGKATMAQLQQMPEMNLFYPSSVVLDPFGYRGDFRNGASAGYILAVQASADDVLAFYRQQLPTLGWVEIINSSRNARGTSEVQAQTWYKGGVIFRYAEKDQTHPTVGQSSYRTVYLIEVWNMQPDEVKYFANLTPSPPQRTPSPRR